MFILALVIQMKPTQQVVNEPTLGEFGVIRPYLISNTLL